LLPRNDFERVRLAIGKPIEPTAFSQICDSASKSNPTGTLTESAERFELFALLDDEWSWQGNRSRKACLENMKIAFSWRSTYLHIAQDFHDHRLWHVIEMLR
jgi:hypothetical protein